MIHMVRTARGAADPEPGVGPPHRADPGGHRRRHRPCRFDPAGGGSGLAALPAGLLAALAGIVAGLHPAESLAKELYIKKYHSWAVSATARHAWAKTGRSGILGQKGQGGSIHDHHPKSRLAPPSSVPRVTWGHWQEEGDRTILYLSLELNHRLLDGCTWANSTRP